MIITYINFLASLLLLLNFGLLMQRRLLSQIRLLVLQGIVLSIDIALVAHVLQKSDLYISLLLTVLLKIWLIPQALFYLLNRLKIRTRVEQLFNMPITLLIGVGLVILAFTLSIPLIKVSTTSNPDTLAIALANIFIAFFVMVVKRKAISQVIGFLSLENCLFFLAISATSGIPMIVELGIAFDILIGLFIFGIFFFQIRDTFDSFDIRNLEKLKDE